jgi:hypothetical protein
MAFMGELLARLVKNARAEEVNFMVERNIRGERSVDECWQVTGKARVSVRCVDANKGGLLEWIARSRLVARDFKGNDKNRDDLFAEAPPLEAKRLLI